MVNGNSDVSTPDEDTIFCAVRFVLPLSIAWSTAITASNSFDLWENSCLRVPGLASCNRLKNVFGDSNDLDVFCLALLLDGKAKT